MEFIDFEVQAGNIDDDKREEFLSSDEDDSFIDDASDISESVSENYAFQNVEVNIDDVIKNVHQKAISDLGKASQVLV